MADPPKSIWTPHGEHTPSTPSPVTELARRAQAAMEAYQRNPEPDSETIAEMKLNRRVAAMRKVAEVGANQISFATGRSHDPMFYWRQSNIPYDYTREDELVKLRKYSRLVYLTEPVIAACVDVYSYWPLTGAHLNCKDDALTEFYEDHFFNDLDYEAYLPEVARNYWNAGEALPLGQFNPTLGIWEDEELINPDDVKVIKTPFQKEPRFEMRVPEEVRDIVAKREPEWEYRMLVKNYPELVRFAQTEEYMPVSNINMKHLAFRPDSYFHRGIPIIMRAFRAIYQEEMLNAAVDSIASRLYTPLVLVRLGASATDMGTDAPWVPTADDLQAFEMALDTALAADFRVMTSHFATQVDQVFGRESMPDFTGDYDRLMDRKLLAFGLSRTMLMGASSGETYAADALNRDLVSILLRRLQKLMIRFYDARAEVVAEAQQHYDYEERGGKRYPIMEEKLIIEEDGTKRIIQKPKLLWPKMEFDVLNLHDEDQIRQFKEALRETGVPISMATRVHNIGIDLDEEYEKVREEQIRMAVETQQTRKEAFLELQKEDLPIPEDLERDFGARVSNDEEVAAGSEPPDPMGMGGAPGDEEGGDMQEPLPNEMIDPATQSAAYTPTSADMAGGTDEDIEGDADPDTPPEMDPMSALQNGNVMLMPIPPRRPPESDEKRKGMPRASALVHPSEVFEGDPFMSIDNEPEQGPYRLISGPRTASRNGTRIPDLMNDPEPEWDD